MLCKIPKLFQLMKERGINAKQLSQGTGISTGNISDWKSGKAAPSAKSLAKLSEFFGVTTDYLLGNTDQTKKPLVNDDEELTEYLEQLKTRPEMRMMFQLAKGATKEDVEKAVKIVEAFLKK